MPETLIAYGLPWDWDEVRTIPPVCVQCRLTRSQHDNNYIIIKKWIDDDFQEQLFAHTRRLRETKMLTETSHSMTELKVNDRRKDKMFLVRKKSPSGRVRVFA